MVKKWLALLLAAVMVFSLGASVYAADGNEENQRLEPAAALVQQIGYSAALAVTYGVDPNEIVYDNHLTVGSTTPMSGNFFTNMWGNTSSDIDVRNLIHACNLIRWDGENGMFTVDPSVVTGITVTENPAGDRTYTFEIGNNLRYSDGSPITAWDYAFSYLLRLSPEVMQVGAVPMQAGYLVGSEQYQAGTTEVLSGVRVTADNTIAVTLDGDYLPFFYEMGLLSCNPYPISVIAPGCTVQDNGNGVLINGPFTAPLLDRTLNDPTNGYRTHPGVVSGPYTLTSFDGTTAEFARNPYFTGNAYGEMPLLENLTFTRVTNERMIDQLRNGEIDLLNKVTNVGNIDEGMSMIPEGQTGMSNYPRTGLSYIIFDWEKPTVSSASVRQAIAWCMDRDAVVADYTGNYGIRVDGYYGVGQWMYGVVNGTIAPPVDPPENELDAKAVEDYEKELKAWEELSLEDLTDYEVDKDRAAALLTADGWTLNADGLREKWVNGQKVVLDLTMIYAEGNRIAESFEKYLVPNLEKVGIRLTMKPMSMAEISRNVYQTENRDADMIFFASNFDTIFDPSVFFVVDDTADNWSFTNQTDRELYRRALVMRETEPGEVLEYMQKWVSFQERFNEILPMIPLYSNVYFDFYTGQLQDYSISQNSTWGEAILGSVKADIPAYEIEVAEDAEEAGDGEIVIDG